MRLLAVALILLSIPFARTHAQTPPEQQQTPSIQVQSNLVLVPTLVKDKKGNPVFTLTANDFTVTDNGVEQKIKLEEDTDSQPLALVVAIETGGAGARQLDLYRNLTPLIEAAVGNVPHRVAIVDFDSQPRLLHDFTSDLDSFPGYLQDLLIPGDKDAAIFDALAYSVNLLREQPPEYRRAILLISETVDHGSQIKLGEALRAISDTNTTIYSVAFSTTKSDLKEDIPRAVNNPDRPGPAGGCMAKDPDNPDQNRLVQFWDCIGLLAPPLKIAQAAVMAGVTSLHKNAPESVAHLTGGEFYKFKNAKSLEKDLLTISNRIPNRYVLSFRPQQPTPGPHALEVKLKNYSGLDITARNTYWIDDKTVSPAQ
jgi:VWFA-related protein